MFVHVVNFYLKADLSAADIKTFEEGVKSLSAVETLVTFNVGKPAATDCKGLQLLSAHRVQ